MIKGYLIKRNTRGLITRLVQGIVADQIYWSGEQRRDGDLTLHINEKILLKENMFT